MSILAEFFDTFSETYDADLPELGWHPVRLIESWPFECTAADAYLDIGCAAGTVLAHAAQRCTDLSGMDLSPGMITQAQKKPALAQAQLQVADVNGPLPFPTARFTRVTCLAMLEFAPDLGPVFAELARILRPGGRALITVEDAWNLQGKAMPRVEQRYDLFSLYRHDLETVDRALPAQLTRTRTVRTGAYTEPESGHTAAYLIIELHRGPDPLPARH